MSARGRPREMWPNGRYRKPPNLTRRRILGFLLALGVISASPLGHPWSMLAGIVAYIVIVLPALPSRPHYDQTQDRR